MNNRKGTGLEALFVFSSIILLLFLIVLLFGSMNYIRMNFPAPYAPLNEKLFVIAVAVSIVTTLGWWIEGRVNYLIKKLSIRRINGKRRS